MKANENVGGLDNADFFDPNKQDPREVDEVLHLNAMEGLKCIENILSNPEKIAELTRSGIENLLWLADALQTKDVFHGATPEDILMAKEMMNEVKIKALIRQSEKRASDQKVNDRPLPKTSKKSSKSNGREISYNTSRGAIRERGMRRVAS